MRSGALQQRLSKQRLSLQRLSQRRRFAQTDGKSAVFEPNQENQSPQNRRRAPEFPPKVAQCLPSPEWTRWARLWRCGLNLSVSPRRFSVIYAKVW